MQGDGCYSNGCGNFGGYTTVNLQQDCEFG